MIHRIGNTSVQKIWETDLNGMTFSQLLPNIAPDERQRHPEWFPVGTFDYDDHAFMSLHAWLVRHEGRTILIDAGAGNDKPRPQQMVLDHLSNPFVERLKDAGVEPADIDIVLHTHIHSDHVGWDTRLVDGQWQPTFPNAQILVSELEYAYGLALSEGDEAGIRAARARAGLGNPVRVPVSGTFADSVKPLAERGFVRPIAVDGPEVLPGIRFLSTPGHSIDHASIELTSGGEVALFTGDVFHHPVEVFDPDLVSVFCEFPDASRRSLRAFLDRAADICATIFTSHFPNSSVGRIARHEGSSEWIGR